MRGVNQISLSLRGKSEDDRIRVALDASTKSQLLIEMAAAIAAVAQIAQQNGNEEAREGEAADDAQ